MVRHADKQSTVKLDGSFDLTALHAATGLDQGVPKAHCKALNQPRYIRKRAAITAISAQISKITNRRLLDMALSGSLKPQLGTKLFAQRFNCTGLQGLNHYTSKLDGVTTTHDGKRSLQCLGIGHACSLQGSSMSLQP